MAIGRWVFSRWGVIETVFGHEMDHRGELRDDRLAFKSYASGASVGKVWAPRSVQNQPKMSKHSFHYTPHLLYPDLKTARLAASPAQLMTFMGCGQAG